MPQLSKTSVQAPVKRSVLLADAWGRALLPMPYPKRLPLGLWVSANTPEALILGPEGTLPSSWSMG